MSRSVIDHHKAIELLRATVEAAGPNFRYQQQTIGPKCVYIANGEPSCLIAKALRRGGWSVSDLDNLGNCGADLLPAMTDQVTCEAADVFFAAQTYQDSFKTWGEALAEAEREYRSILLGEDAEPSLQFQD